MSNDINTPPSDKEVSEWIAALSENDKSELKRRQLEAAAVNRRPEKAPDLSRMTDSEFAAYRRSLGIG
jgi:hypothetical protein